MYFKLSWSYYMTELVHLLMFNLVGCFSILPATELVPGDIVEVGGMNYPMLFR